MDQNKEKLIIIFSVIGVLVLYITNFLLLYYRPDKAAIGDMFCAVNALFTGLAFAGIIVTIYLQREDLRLTRQELEGQKLQLKAQNETLRRQSFENTFFQLLGLHNDIVNAITYYFNENTYKGRECFERLYSDLKYKYVILKEKGGMDEREIVTMAYENYFKNVQSSIGHYFRNLYHIYKYIHKHELEIYKKDTPI